MRKLLFATSFVAFAGFCVSLSAAAAGAADPNWRVARIPDGKGFKAVESSQNVAAGVYRKKIMDDGFLKLAKGIFRCSKSFQLKLPSFFY